MPWSFIFALILPLLQALLQWLLGVTPAQLTTDQRAQLGIIRGYLQKIDHQLAVDNVTVVAVTPMVELQMKAEMESFMIPKP